MIHEYVIKFISNQSNISRFKKILCNGFSSEFYINSNKLKKMANLKFLEVKLKNGLQNQQSLMFFEA